MLEELAGELEGGELVLGAGGGIGRGSWREELEGGKV